ncbi:unnamed protein product [Calypogeia fissa]
MASLVQFCATSLQQRGWGCVHDSQFTLSFSEGMGERLVSYSPSPLWKRSPSSPGVSTLYQIQPGHRKYIKFQAVTETLHHSETSLEEPSTGKLNVVLEAARTEEKLRAAATLRARSFYSYPEGRSRDALVMHQQMKAEDEWTTLTRKVGGMEPGYKRTTCVVAVCPLSDVLDTSTDLLQSHCKISLSRAEECVVVGTLDINQGLLLPGELSGDHPQGLDAEHRRAYLSNVCVAKEVRRRGVGLLLMQYVKKTVKLWGISDLYVHVVVDNISARQLYEKAGFIYEKEEAVKDARSMCRPRRYLLRTQL